MKFSLMAMALAFWAGAAFGFEREFTPDEGSIAGCERAGFKDSFLFQRNGRVGTLKFPVSGAAFVLFQVNTNDLYRWSVRNDSDSLDMDFERGSLSYRNGGGGSAFSCEGSFPPRN